MMTGLFSEPDEVLWSGQLEPAEHYRGSGAIQAAIGRTMLLSGQSEVMSGDRRHPVARLAFTAAGMDGAVVAAADLRVILENNQSYVSDVQPQETFEEQVHPIKFGLTPKIKFADSSEAGVLTELTFSLPLVVPVVTVSGLQTNACAWHFRSHPRHPLAGSRTVLVVLSIPVSILAVTVRIELDVFREDRFFGLVRYGMSAAAQDAARWVV